MQKEKHNSPGTQADSYIVKFDTYLSLRFPVHISFQKWNSGERRMCLMDASKTPLSPLEGLLSNSFLTALYTHKNNVQPYFSPSPFKPSSKLSFLSSLQHLQVQLAQGVAFIGLALNLSTYLLLNTETLTFTTTPKSFEIFPAVQWLLKIHITDSECS